MPQVESLCARESSSEVCYVDMRVVHFPMSCYVDMHVAIDFALFGKALQGFLLLCEG